MFRRQKRSRSGMVLKGNSLLRPFQWLLNFPKCCKEGRIVRGYQRVLILTSRRITLTSRFANLLTIFCVAGRFVGFPIKRKETGLDGPKLRQLVNSLGTLHCGTSSASESEQEDESGAEWRNLNLSRLIFVTFPAASWEIHRNTPATSYRRLVAQSNASGISRIDQRSGFHRRCFVFTAINVTFDITEM